MKLRYKYRIYPTLSQEQQMISVGGSVRYLYNHFLKVNIDQYQIDKKFVWQFDMCRQLTLLKQQLPWLTKTYSQVLQQSLKDLDQALNNMKRGLGFPKFKSKYTTPISFRYQQHTSISDDFKYLNLPKLGLIRIKLHRALPSKYTGCTIMQTTKGWFASFVVELQEHKLVDDISNPVGVDVNSKYTALSTGELIKNPKPLKKSFPKIKKLQRQLSRKTKGSKNRLKSKHRLAIAHSKVARQRINFIHQISNRIAKDYDLVLVETLNIEGMKKNKYAAKAIADSGWAMLANALEYKCQILGHHLLHINQWLASSKTCSSCGNKQISMPLNKRVFNCDDCDAVIHRDTNAAINIKNWGHQQWMHNNKKSRQELPVAPVDVMMDIIANCGGISQSQMKQEAVSL